MNVQNCKYMSVHGYAGLRFDVQSWSPKTDRGIFEESKKKLEVLVYFNFSKAYFLEGRLFFGHRGCFWKMVLDDFQSPTSCTIMRKGSVM